jgi:hypothetical protein
VGDAPTKSLGGDGFLDFGDRGIEVGDLVPVGGDFGLG